MERVVDLIKPNNESLYKLRKAGILSIDILTDYYSIYQVYLGYSNVKEKMVRYSMTAEKSKVSMTSVRRIINLMEKKI